MCVHVHIVYSLSTFCTDWRQQFQNLAGLRNTDVGCTRQNVAHKRTHHNTWQDWQTDTLQQ